MGKTTIVTHNQRQILPFFPSDGSTPSDLTPDFFCQFNAGAALSINTDGDLHICEGIYHINATITSSVNILDRIRRCHFRWSKNGEQHHPYRVMERPSPWTISPLKMVKAQMWALTASSVCEQSPASLEQIRVLQTIF